MARPGAVAAGRLRRCCLLLLLGAARGAYFLMEEGQERCFSVDIAELQVLRIRYSVREHEVARQVPRQDAGPECKVALQEPSGQVVKEHALQSGNQTGTLTHAVQEEGSHSVCLKCAAQDWFGTRRKLRWSIAFDVLGEGGGGVWPDTDPKHVASLAHLKGAQAGIDMLLGRVAAISTENEYERTFEANFVRASQAVNADVAAFKLLQVLLIAGVTAFQVHHLAQFLRRNRIFDCSCLPLRNKPIV